VQERNHQQSPNTSCVPRSWPSSPVPATNQAPGLGLKVDSREELDAWADWFEEQGVTHSPIVDATYGSALTFKDPDLFQLEMFYRPNHP